jgi:hypothetical protein
MDTIRLEIIDEMQSTIEFINKTKEGHFSEKESILNGYVIRHEFPEELDFLNDTELIEQYHFGLSD